MTLFMAVTNGMSWRDAFEPMLHSLDPCYACLFLLYVTTVLFCVMNVLTSVFVESAVMSAQHYKDLLIQEREHKRAIAMTHVRQVFEQIDEDRSGDITADEMECFLEDPRMRQYFDALDIHVDDARMMFRMLDTDESQRVDINEFCEGCLRLQGEAKSFDVHVMMFQVQLFLNKWSEFTVFVEERFAMLRNGKQLPTNDRQMCNYPSGQRCDVHEPNASTGRDVPAAYGIPTSSEHLPARHSCARSDAHEPSASAGSAGIGDM
mmetsp:Transcript_39608/g.114604  ORF Transcript_39608/g.114604 Transcript_39608/m.114604 type:complete len:263 (-) Transcript_39608:546-1334(-)